MPCQTSPGIEHYEFSLTDYVILLKSFYPTLTLSIRGTSLLVMSSSGRIGLSRLLIFITLSGMGSLQVAKHGRVLFKH